MILGKPLFPRPEDWVYEKWAVIEDQEIGPDGSLLFLVIGRDCWGRECWEKKIRTYAGAEGTRDLRNLELTAAGCCPPELTKDFIQQERFGDASADAAEEAIKLHKRGYFGGGK